MIDCLINGPYFPREKLLLDCDHQLVTLNSVILLGDKAELYLVPHRLHAQRVGFAQPGSNCLRWHTRWVHILP